MFAQLGHLPGLLLLSCLHLLPPEEELVFRGMVCWVTRHDSEFQRSGGMFKNGQGFGDREITWERVYPSSSVSPLRFLARRFPQTAPIIVSRILRVSGSPGHSPVTSRLKPARQTRRRRWCSVVPPMAKLGFFRKTKLQNCSYLNRECCTSFGVILFSFMEGERGSTFHGEWTISSHKGRGRWLSFRER